MHRRLPTIALLCITLHLAAQDVYFKDDFSDNHNEWSFPSDGCSIATGNYVIDNRDDNALASWQTVDMPRYGNYAIEIRTSHESGTEDWGYGLLFAAADFQNCYIFEIASGSYRIRELLEDSSMEVVGWTDDASIRKNAGDWNTLRMDSYRNRWSFYCNGHLLFSKLQSLPFGTKAGPFLTHQQRVLFDDFVVGPVRKWSEKDPSEMEILSLCDAVKKVAGMGKNGFSTVVGDKKDENRYSTLYNVDGAYEASITTYEQDTAWDVLLDVETSWAAATDQLNAEAAQLTDCASSLTFYKTSNDELLFPIAYAGSSQQGDSIQKPRAWLEAASYHASVDSAVITMTIEQGSSPIWFHPITAAQDPETPLARSIAEVFAQFAKGYSDWKGEQVDKGFWSHWNCKHPVAGALECRVSNTSIWANGGVECLFAKATTQREAQAKLAELLTQLRAALGPGFYEAQQLVAHEPEHEFRKFGSSGVTIPVVNAFIINEADSYNVKLYFRSLGLMF
jgi:hypothetical protein